MADRAPIIIVTGMHRSGTSLTVNLLRQCGLWLGAENELHGATADNPDGHWENIAVTETNDMLLNELGGGWDDVPEFPAGWLANFSAQQGRAAEIHAALARPTPWGWKDPRASLLLPFWLALAPDARVVICVRHPLEVAHSLRRRGLMSYALGLKLWRDYNARLLADVPQHRAHPRTAPGSLSPSDGERVGERGFELEIKTPPLPGPLLHPMEEREKTGAVRGGVPPQQRLVVHYEHFFTQPLKTLRRLTDFCGLKISEAELEKISATAKPELRHTQFDFADLVAVSVAPEIAGLYSQLCEKAGFADAPEFTTTGEPAAPRQLDLAALAHRIFLRQWRWFVQKNTPASARVAVVSKGDDELLQLHGRAAEHFPRNAAGAYLGHHPAASAEASAQLAAARDAGAEFFALPASAAWWLDCYPEFHRQLEKHFTRLEADPRVGLIYDLRRRRKSAA